MWGLGTSSRVYTRQLAAQNEVTVTSLYVSVLEAREEGSAGVGHGSEPSAGRHRLLRAHTQVSIH